jgi:hypothetical protein
MPRHAFPAVVVALLISGLSAGARQAPARSASAQKLPPLSYICTMAGDEDVIEDKPGKCPKCGMGLQGIRLDSVWTCPVHAAIVRDQPGACPIDRRELVQVTMALSFACAGSSKESINPFTCPDGSPAARKYAARAHGNHNPQHGGGFFMAPDNWHHLEGAYFAPGTFRLYLYDDFTKPLPPAKARAAQARLVTADGRDVPLVRTGPAFEAKVGALPFPVSVQARVRFGPAEPEHRFDFTFDKFSVDRPSAPAVTSAAPARMSTPSPAPAAAPPTATPPAASPAPAAGSSATPGDASVAPSAIPDTIPAMLAQLRSHNEEIKAFIDRGAFAAVYVPAFQAKDVALALDERRGTLPPDRQRALEPAVKRLIRTAYLLDAFGDLGNKQQIVEAYAGFAAAVGDIESAFPKQP